MNELSVKNNMKRVGEILRVARESKELGYEDVHRLLKIHPKYIQALETGNYRLFSSPVHVKGFLKTYSKFLDLNVDEVLAFFRKEFDEKKIQVSGKHKVGISHPMLFITPSTVTLIATFILFGLFFSYLYYQYKSYSGNPSLKIESPASDISSSSEKVLVAGSVDRDSTVYLNGQKIELDNNGKFQFELDLSAGINVLNFLAVSRLGKETKIVRTVVAETPNSKLTLGPKVSLEIVAEGGSSTITLFESGVEVFSGILASGTSRIFESTSSVKLKSSNAGVIRLRLNGVDIGLFGRMGEAKEQEFK